MKECLNKESVKRPSAKEIYERITNWKNYENLILELEKFEEKLKNTHKFNDDDLPVYSYEFTSESWKT
ncbi:3682_t:CDS:2 [Cetraspora pellucida]|uniref:3682_t:CDS:1 n=1 Tax=Cetraspora pellucida TaxID=1433469 RepID=A0ACA9JY10_9GLOM|nr:3682_t:CDS:2 [Cetraspora pellucida]